MKKSINIFSIISLIISMIATGMFWLLLGKVAGFLYAPWLVIGTISIFFPIIAKYLRKRNGHNGSGFEIAAIILGFYNFYWVLSVATKWHLTIIMLLCVLVCVLYGVLFKKVQEKVEVDATTKRLSISAPVLVSLFSCVCTLFLVVDSAIQGSDSFLFWLITFIAYYVTTSLFIINHKENNVIIAIINVCIMTAFVILGIMMAIAGEAYDYSGESVVVFYISLLSTFALFVLSIISLFKVKWNFDFYYNSIKYREKCYKRVEKMKRYLDNGIITQEEFLKNKSEILKHIK